MEQGPSMVEQVALVGGLVLLLLGGLGWLWLAVGRRDIGFWSGRTHYTPPPAWRVWRSTPAPVAPRFGQGRAGTAGRPGAGGSLGARSSARGT